MELQLDFFVGDVAGTSTQLAHILPTMMSSKTWKHPEQVMTWMPAWVHHSCTKQIALIQKCLTSSEASRFWDSVQEVW